MPKLYLLGGENVLRRSAREVNEHAFQEARAPLAVLVFAWARASFDRGYKKKKSLFDYFLSLGASSVTFVDYSDSINVIAKKMADSSLIYLTGGLPLVLVERFRKMGVDLLLSNYDGVIIGRSAGALALCNKYVITYRSNSKTKVVNGLGLADLTLKVHYALEKDEVLEQLSRKEKIYAVPEGSALVYDSGNLSCIGTAYLFENGEKRNGV